MTEPAAARFRHDFPLLFITRCARMFAYGGIAVIFFIYLVETGMSRQKAGGLLTFTLLGDTLISLYLTTTADRIGRRRTLIIGAMLMVFGGIVAALTRDPMVLLIAATLGVISPSGTEVGPFLAVEQAALTEIIPGERRTSIFAWYNLAGYFAAALGSLLCGSITGALQRAGFSVLDSYRAVLFGYAGVGMVLIVLFSRVSRAVEVPPIDETEREKIKRLFGLHRSKGIVLWLAGLFAIDAFAGGFVGQALAADWFKQKFHASDASLGWIFFATNTLAGFSSLGAAAIARRIGLINTMVFTHAPSNIFLMLVPFMPNLEAAVAMLMLRSCLSQMDVPTRQSYVAAVVDPDERSAAAGITGVVRTLGAAISPSIAGKLLATPGLLGMPFIISGGLKLVYDGLLYVSFRSRRTPEETLAPSPTGRGRG